MPSLQTSKREKSSGLESPSEQFTVVQIMPEDWEKAEPMFELKKRFQRALDHGLCVIDATHLEDLVLERNAQAWAVMEGLDMVAVAATEVRGFPLYRALNIYALEGSRFDEWSPLLDSKFKKFARLMSCDVIECYVRKGLAKKLRSLGYKEATVVVSKPVEDTSDG